MPTYRYKCRKCKKEFECVQSIHDKALTEHRECGGIMDRLMPTRIGIQFKGEGFYSNDKNI